MTKRADAQALRSELSEQRRKVDFDTYDVTVDELIRRVEKKRIDIAPVYQRQFRWDVERQSRLVESVYLGIPVPPLFMATNKVADEQSRWEVVDGLQRLLSLVNFCGSDGARLAAGLGSEPKLTLDGLDKVPSFAGYTFADLPEDIRSDLEDRPIRVVVLNDKSDIQVRFDLFERLNTGGIPLTDHEVRECVFRGEFIDLLATLAERKSFKTVVRLPASSWKDGTPAEYVLRFFAFLDRYANFDHSVKDFLNIYTRIGWERPDVGKRTHIFDQTFDYLATCFPDGLRGRQPVTPVNLFEAVSVGAALALKTNPQLPAATSTKWTDSAELRKFTTGATNSRPKVKGRIEFARDRLLENV